MSTAVLVAVIGVVGAALIGAVGFMLSRLIREADKAALLRHDMLAEAIRSLRYDLNAVAKRHDEALTAQSDLIREGFGLASRDGSELGQRIARIEGTLGVRPVLPIERTG